jgi:hypothetical protein
MSGTYVLFRLTYTTCFKTAPVYVFVPSCSCASEIDCVYVCVHAWVGGWVNVCGWVGVGVGGCERTRVKLWIHADV